LQKAESDARSGTSNLETRESCVKYTQVVKWSAKGDSIQLEMLGEDQEIHRLEVSADCAGVLAGALASEMEKLDGPRKQQQLVRPTGMQTGKTEQGEPILFMTFQGGTELPLVFKREALGVLISELEKLKGVLGATSEVRWQ
jgi:hypothetical protein